MPFARGFGIWELIIILVIVMMIFGVGRLTEVGGTMGRAIKEFRKSQDDDKDEQPPTDNSESKVEEKSTT